MAGSRGSPHSSHSVMVSGMDGSSIVVTTSTNGTSATTARHRSGAMENTAPWSSPPADRPRETIRSGAAQPLAGQQVGRRDEVGERGALAVQMALVPPAAAALPAAAHVRHRVDEPAVQQARRGSRELRPGRRLVRAVAVQQDRRGAVAAQPAPVRHGDRDRGAVGGGAR